MRQALFTVLSLALTVAGQLFMTGRPPSERSCPRVCPYQAVPQHAGLVQLRKAEPAPAAYRPCPDVNGDGAVDVADLVAILAFQGSDCTVSRCAEDINGDGRIEAEDLLAVLGHWGPSDG